jgi:hypothetical protein
MDIYSVFCNTLPWILRWQTGKVSRENISKDSKLKSKRCVIVSENNIFYFTLFILYLFKDVFTFSDYTSIVPNDMILVNCLFGIMQAYNETALA